MEKVDAFIDAHLADLAALVLKMVDNFMKGVEQTLVKWSHLLTIFRHAGLG